LEVQRVPAFTQSVLYIVQSHRLAAFIPKYKKISSFSHTKFLELSLTLLTFM